MTIQELLDRAHTFDSSLSLEAHDRFDYGADCTAPDRVTTVTAWKPGGSHEDITLEMAGDQVIDIIPGKTSIHWQVTPLLAAFYGWERSVPR